METEKTTNSSKDEIKFTKEQLRNSEKYRKYVDILSVVLEDDKTYSFAETDKMIDNFLNSKAGGKRK